jgi:hypothetical protein
VLRGHGVHHINTSFSGSWRVLSLPVNRPNPEPSIRPPWRPSPPRRGLLIGLAGLRTSAHEQEAADRSQEHHANTCCHVVSRERVGARRGAHIDFTALVPSVGRVARARRHAPGLSPANLRKSLLK